MFLWNRREGLFVLPRQWGKLCIKWLEFILLRKLHSAGLQ
jgi:hypothetical protein